VASIVAYGACTLQAAVIPVNAPALGYDALSPGGVAELFTNHIGTDFGWTLGDGAAAPTRIVDPLLSGRAGIDAAWRFDGSNGQMTRGTFDGQGSSADASFEIWFKPDSGTNEGILFETGGSGSGMSLLYDADADTVSFVIKNGSNAANKRQLISHTLTAGELSDFVQVVGVYDRDAGTNEMQLFVNGNNQVATSVGVSDINDWSGSADAGISAINGDLGGDTANPGDLRNGVEGNYTPGRFDGQIAVFNLHNSALTGAQIQENFDDYSTLTNGGGIIPGAKAEYNAELDQDNDNVWVNEAQPGVRDYTGVAGNLSGPNVSSYPGINYAYDFNGTTTATTADFENFNEQNSATFEIWFKPDDVDAVGKEVLWETGGNTVGTSFTLDGSTGLELAFNNTKSGQRTASIDLKTFLSTDELNEFIQAVGVIDMNDDKMLLYVNGRLAGTFAASGSDWSGSHDSGLGGFFVEVGGISADGSFGSFDGMIAQFRIYESTIFTLNAVEQNFLAIVVPEPATFVLSAIGVLRLLVCRRRRKR